MYFTLINLHYQSILHIIVNVLLLSCFIFLVFCNVCTLDSEYLTVSKYHVYCELSYKSIASYSSKVLLFLSHHSLFQIVLVPIISSFSTVNGVV